MENHLNQFTKSAHEVRLDDGATSRIRERLIAHMRTHPFVPSPYQRFFGVLSPFTSLLRKPVFVTPLAFLLVFGGASAYAATDALPGDILYPMKTGLIEPIRGLFAVSDEAKAAWKISLTETRLMEVEQLVVKKQLTPEERTKSEERFNAALDEAREVIQKLSETNPGAAERIESSFSASLGEHQRTLSSLEGATTTGAATETHSFVEFIKQEIAPQVQGVSTSTKFLQQENLREIREEINLKKPIPNHIRP